MPTLNSKTAFKNCIDGLKCYHGLLLTDDKHRVLEKLQLRSFGTNPSVVRFINVYNPTKTLQTLADHANFTLKEVMRIVACLVCWDYAIVIYPLAETNMYALSPSFPIENANALTNQFKNEFPGYDLLNIMHQFSTTTSFRHVMSYVDKYVTSGVVVTEIIIWLLRHRILTQFHTFLYHVTQSNGSCTESETYHQEQNMNRQFQLRLSNGSGSSAFAVVPQGQRQNSLRKYPQVQLTHRPEDLSRLMELLQRGYLTGKYHLEEIAYLERVQPMVIIELLNCFQDVIRVYETEDALVFKCNNHKR